MTFINFAFHFTGNRRIIRIPSYFILKNIQTDFGGLKIIVTEFPLI
jgi:hypothetical protein